MPQDRYNTIIYNSKNFLDFGLTISGPSVYNGPQWDAEQISIPGRHGALLLPKERLQPIEITYHGVIISDGTAASSVKARTQQLRDYLYRNSYKGQYKQLSDTYNSDTYRMAAFLGPLEVTPGYMHKWAEMDITFTCNPQRYIVDQGVITVASGDAYTLTPPIYSGGAYRAEPLITVTAPGTITLGGAEFTISDGAFPLILDCEAMTVYDNNGTLCNGRLSNVYYWPKIQGGETIANNTTGGIIIDPRWWTV